MSASPAATASTLVVTPELQHEIEQVLYAEADLLDDGEFVAWLDVLADDCRYWMPTRTNRQRRERGSELGADDGLSLFEETKATLAQRVKRIETGMAWAEDPPSRTRHLVTNVRLRSADEPAALDVTSAFLLYRTRLETDENLFAGRREDRWRRSAEGSWKLARRKIVLDQNVILAKNLSVFF